MHRKRGGSLEQKLVHSPFSSRASAELNPAPTFRDDSFSQWQQIDDDCLSRVPFTSLAAFLFCLVGVGLFTTMILWAFNASVELFRRTTFITDLPWLDKVQLFFIINAVAMFLVALAFLLIGVLSTGQTRVKIFRRGQARTGGRVSCVVAICLASALNIVWMIILALTAVMSFMFATFTALCANPQPNSGGHSCLNLSAFRPLFPPSNDPTFLELCNGQLQQFCALTNTAVLWYFVGTFGALLVCTGLVLFIATNAANFTHIGNEAKNWELHEIIRQESAAANGLGYSPYEKLGMEQHQQMNQQMDNKRRASWQDRQPTSGYYDSSYSTECNSNCQQMYDLGRPNDRPPHFASRNPRRQPASSANPQNPQKPVFQMRNHQNNHSSNRKSVGAIVDSHRRNSYQASLHGSNSWLNQLPGGPGNVGRSIY